MFFLALLSSTELRFSLKTEVHKRLRVSEPYSCMQVTVIVIFQGSSNKLTPDEKMEGFPKLVKMGSYFASKVATAVQGI